MNIAAGFLETPITSRQATFPEDQSECMGVMKTPDPGAMSLKQEKINRST